MFKVFETLGYPTNIDALLALAMLEKMTVEPFCRNTDCFERAGLAEVVEYAENQQSGLPVAALRYFARGQRRVLVCDLSPDIPAKHLVYASIGLLQYSLNRCGRNEQELLFLYRLAKNILFLLSPDSDYDAKDISLLPGTAYSLAKRATIEDEEVVNKHSEAD